MLVVWRIFLRARRPSYDFFVQLLELGPIAFYTDNIVLEFVTNCPKTVNRLVDDWRYHVKFTSSLLRRNG